MSRGASPPVLWSQNSAYERAVQAVRYLAENYPECGGVEAQDPYHDAPCMRQRLERTGTATWMLSGTA
jgi:hypothetical protein